MCGIVGAVSAQANPHVGALTLRATRALAHRGPDGEGFWLSSDPERVLGAGPDLDRATTIAMGHRRLSIVDIDGGAQPLANEDNTLWVSFNGEIYNHLELRSDLERAGHRFRTRADTEVLVHGYEEWGEDLLGRLNGIFAFALADRRRNEILLARDPVGVKPLYIGIRSSTTWWASELQAAAAAGLVEGRVAPEALKLFLTFRFTPSPHTIFEDAWKLPPSHFARLNPEAAGHKPTFHRYESKVRSTAAPRGRKEWRDAIQVELEAAVKRQLMADVPVAVLLSGGVDSSLVTQLMRSNLSYPPQAFGIGFGADGLANEVLAADRAARELGVPLEAAVVEEGEYIDAWPQALEELGEPIANSGALLVRLISERVGQSHKVVLSGQGADEPLGGYPRHMVERLDRVGRFAPSLGRAIARKAFGPDNASRLERALAAPDRIARYAAIFSVVPAEQVDVLVPEGAPAAELARLAIARWAEEEPGSDTLNELLRVDTRLSLADDLLIIGDHFSMRSSVELRVPFLDLALLELVERMPSKFKISATGERKWLYRQGAERRLPPQLARALAPPGRLTRKRGFSTPSNWFERDDDLLRSNTEWWRALETLPIAPRHLEGMAAAGPRQRTLLFTLATWAERHRDPALAA